MQTITYTPQSEIKNCLLTVHFLKHLFGDNFKVGMNHLAKLYMRTEKKLPILYIYSDVNETGKTTFLKWLAEIFKEHSIVLSDKDLQSPFNDKYINKYVIAIDESINEYTCSVINHLAPANRVVLKRKGKTNDMTDFVGNFIITSNIEPILLDVDYPKIIIKTKRVKECYPSLLTSLKRELPAFLEYLQIHALTLK